MIPIIYDLAEAAHILGFSESYLRSKLRDRTFAGMKRAGRWAMTESDTWWPRAVAVSRDLRPSAGSGAVATRPSAFSATRVSAIDWGRTCSIWARVAAVVGPCSMMRRSVDSSGKLVLFSVQIVGKSGESRSSFGMSPR